MDFQYVLQNVYASCTDLNIVVTVNHKYLSIITAFLIKVVMAFNITEKYLVN